MLIVAKGMFPRERGIRNSEINPIPELCFEAKQLFLKSDDLEY